MIMNTSNTLATTLGMFGMPGWTEITILLVIGVLVFGKRLPEVGRNLGKSIVEFKRGIKGIGDEIDRESERTSSSQTSTTKQADLPPAKVTPDPSADSEPIAEESKQHSEDK